ncbi:hypothetical protein [Novosphingobium sp. BL-52-GroH]|uniref:hypothetical protein n=1 Tax=Novosphingobium sp. BL-52-GroH TaxID=3349877 RepID=UPI00384F392A
MYHSLEDPEFVGDDNPLFRQFRAHGASTGCRVAVTSLSRDGSADPESGAILWVTFPPGFIVTRH